jgi:hypothetical protein
MLYGMLTCFFMLLSAGFATNAGFGDIFCLIRNGMLFWARKLHVRQTPASWVLDKPQHHGALTNPSNMGPQQTPTTWGLNKPQQNGASTNPSKMGPQQTPATWGLNKPQQHGASTNSSNMGPQQTPATWGLHKPQQHGASHCPPAALGKIEGSEEGWVVSRPGLEVRKLFDFALHIQTHSWWSFSYCECKYDFWEKTWVWVWSANSKFFYNL